MAQFRLSKEYTMSNEEVREVAKGLAAELERDHGVRSHWQGDTVNIAASGVKGQMRIGDGVIDISVKLNLLTSMFEPALRGEVQRYLDKHIS